jgi:hypothetical protein
VFGIALGDEFTELADIADAGPEAPLEPITEPFASLAGAGEVKGDSLLTGILLVLITLLGIVLIFGAVR